MDVLPPTLIVFSAQLLVIVGVASAAEALGRVADTDPRLRLMYWRSVALACVTLPLWALVGPEAAGGVMPSIAVSLESASAAVHMAIPGPFSAVLGVLAVVAAADAVWWLLCAGALTRLGWLCAGAVRLRQLRQRSRAAGLTPDLEAIRLEIAPRAEVRVSREIAQPAGFGWRSPIVLLPERFFTMDPQAQQTVVCHELLHVARRDWLWIVVEETARALFWFHPAIWWLVDRIQESREQLVDRLVITRIPSKRAYMEALLAFADSGRGRRAETPAAALLRKRHLRSRLRNLAKESVMSRRRLVWTAVVVVCVMSGAIAGTVLALPLSLPPGTTAAAHPRQVVDGKAPGVTLPRVITEVKPQYTPEALKARIQGTLWLTTVVRTDGTPAEIEITQSLDKEYGLDDQAIEALTQWRFEPGLKDGKPVPVRITIEVRFWMK